MRKVTQLLSSAVSQVANQVNQATSPNRRGMYGYGHQNQYQPVYQQNYQPVPAPRTNVPPPAGISQELWDWFRSVDADNSGRITVDELQRALMNGNWSPFNEETCRLMVGMFDRDKTGTIDIYEFSTLWKYIQDWKRCFDSFDRDRSGTIDVGELHQAFTTFGYRLSPEFCATVVRRFDRAGRNCIQFDDFIQSCVMLHHLTNSFRAKDVTQQGRVTLRYEEFLEMVIDTTIN